MEKSKNIAIVFSDLNMPGAGGLVVLERARQLFPAATRIMMTAEEGVQTAIDALEKGIITRFLSKPWEMGKLQSTIGRILEHWNRDRMGKHQETQLLNKCAVSETPAP